MIITLSIADILDGVYADSALSALTADKGIEAYILSPDNEAALRRLVCDAFAATIAMAGNMWSLITADETELTAEYCSAEDEDLHSTSEKFRTAVTYMLTYIIYRSAENNRAKASLDSAKIIINNLAQQSYHLEQITPNI